VKKPRVSLAALGQRGLVMAIVKEGPGAETDDGARINCPAAKSGASAGVKNLPK